MTDQVDLAKYKALVINYQLRQEATKRKVKIDIRRHQYNIQMLGNPISQKQVLLRYAEGTFSEHYHSSYPDYATVTQDVKGYPVQSLIWAWSEEKTVPTTLLDKKNGLMIVIDVDEDSEKNKDLITRYLDEAKANNFKGNIAILCNSNTDGDSKAKEFAEELRLTFKESKIPIQSVSAKFNKGIREGFDLIYKDFNPVDEISLEAIEDENKQLQRKLLPRHLNIIQMLGNPISQKEVLLRHTDDIFYDDKSIYSANPIDFRIKEKYVKDGYRVMAQIWPWHDETVPRRFDKVNELMIVIDGNEDFEKNKSLITRYLIAAEQENFKGNIAILCNSNMERDSNDEELAKKLRPIFKGSKIQIQSVSAKYNKGIDTAFEWINNNFIKEKIDLGIAKEISKLEKIILEYEERCIEKLWAAKIPLDFLNSNNTLSPTKEIKEYSLLLELKILAGDQNKNEKERKEQCINFIGENRDLFKENLYYKIINWFQKMIMKDLYIKNYVLKIYDKLEENAKEDKNKEPDTGRKLKY